MTSPIGIDFGTTNTAIARSRPGQRAELVSFRTGNGERVHSWRSILYFELDGPKPGLHLTAGSQAIERYLESDGHGRLIQSIKSHLSSASFTRTQIFSRAFELEDLIRAFLDTLRTSADCDLGHRAVVGRPVRYWGSRSQEDEDRAVARMRRALALAGYDEVVFVYEPVAAAFHYAQRLSEPELVLVADFGGGTSDFSLIRVGPKTDPNDPSAILANGGLGVGGDTFDGAIVDHVVAPLLGKGSSFTDELGAVMPVPVWLHGMLRRWHHLSFLKTPETMRLFWRIQRGAEDPKGISAFLQILEEELGFSLHRAVEAAKIDLSQSLRCDFEFAPCRLGDVIERGSFDAWIGPDVRAIEEVIDGVLEEAGVEAGAVDRVFATGGTSFVPRVRGLLAERFGADRIVTGGELISVASGLAECASRLS